MVWFKLLLTDKIFNIIFSANIYLFKVNNKNIWRCEICLQLTVKTPRRWTYFTTSSGVSVTNFERKNVCLVLAPSKKNLLKVVRLFKYLFKVNKKDTRLTFKNVLILLLIIITLTRYSTNSKIAIKTTERCR